MDTPKPIELCFRGESVFMTKGDITGLVDEEWFLSVIVGNDYWKSDLDTLEVNEDKNTAMSIIETMRYNSLIVLNNVSLDYMLVLAEKWCIPDQFIQYIKDKKTNPDETLTNDKTVNNMVFKCTLCNTGFKIKENKKDSCKYHATYISPTSGRFICCNGTLEDQPCHIGYHLMSDHDKNKCYEMLAKINN